VTASNRPWWETAVTYQIYPRSFCDGSGDGIGDLEGIRRHLDYLSWLGVDAIWLSPFYPSPMADFGYDVSDYCDVDPLFGTLVDFDRLVTEAHRLGLKVLVDWVPNHTSDQHPWFVASRSSRDDPKRAWYWWRDDRPDDAGGSGPPASEGRLPNNWRAAFPGVGLTELPPAWTRDEASGQWYLHLFLPQQPDLNWTNPQVRAAMAEVLRFWLARGVDGFRVDVIHGLGKDPALADLPPELAPVPISAINDQPATHPIIAALRTELDQWPDPPPRMMVGEVFLPEPAQVVTYYGSAEHPELHLAFNFKPLFTGWDAAAWRRRIDEVEILFEPRGAWPTWVLSNHDRPRHRTRYGSEARARAAAVLLLTLRGTPFLYAGEELGLENADVPLERRLDPGGRDACRAPIPWDGTPGHGWAGGPNAWLPWPPGADAGRTVAEERVRPASMLHLYRTLLAVRRESEALRTGEFSWWPGGGGDGDSGPAGVLAYLRTAGGTAGSSTHSSTPDSTPSPTPAGAADDVRLVVVNFTDAPEAIDLPPGQWTVQVSTGAAGAAGAAGLASSACVAGRVELAADEAAVLRPAATPREPAPAPAAPANSVI
jgi:alpha-glucosidase